MIIGLPFLYVAYLIIKYYKSDNDSTRDGLSFAGIIFAFNYVVFNVSVVFLHVYFNTRMPMGTPGAYPDSAI